MARDRSPPAKVRRTSSPQDKMILDCMVRNWEAKMRLKLKQSDAYEE